MIVILRALVDSPVNYHIEIYDAASVVDYVHIFKRFAVAGNIACKPSVSIHTDKHRNIILVIGKYLIEVHCAVYGEINIIEGYN